MSRKYKFPCGCEFDLNDNGGIIIREHEFKRDCAATYQLIIEGRTIGCFQIESQLLVQWCKKIKPTNLDEMCDLVAIVRPGTLKSIFKIVKDGDKFKEITAADWYVMVKNGDVPIEYFHPALEPVLKKTNGIMLFQEQMLQIAVLIAMFNEIEADLLRRGIGKKKAEIVAECKRMFIDKAISVGILTKEQAEELFHQIEAANRYSFNKSHSWCYGVTSYESAYYKQHFPLEFFCSSLALAMTEPEPLIEMRRVIKDANRHNFNVIGPNIDDLKANFYIKNGELAFGLSNIKGVGENTIVKLSNNVDKAVKLIGKPIEEWSWFEFLINLTVSKEGSVFGASNLEKIVGAGAIDRGVSRKRMLFELENWELLTKGEKEWMLKNQSLYDNLLAALKDMAKPKKEGGGCHNADRLSVVQSIIKLLDKPPTNLDDTIISINKMETELMGISLSCSKIEACDTSSVNCTLEEFATGKRLQWYVLGVECNRVHTNIVKNGQSKGREMAFLTLEDETGELDDCVIFCDEWERFNYLLQPGNTVLVEGQKDKAKGSFIIKNVEQL